MKKQFLLLLLLLPFVVKAQYISGCGPYSNSGPITLSSNTTVSGKLIDLGNASTVGITGNGVTNVHITKCKIINTTNFAILLNGCTNITIDSCYISNVGFGVYAQSGSAQIKVNGNYFLNINGISTTYLGHAVQFNGVNSGGNQINNNRIENILGVAIHPHDMINVFQSNGLPADSIQVIGNWIRGGQYYYWPDTNSGAAGIIVGDVSGSYQVARNNICVNTGYAGIQCPGTGSHIKIDHNLLYSDYSPVSHQAITILDANQIECSYNQTNWTNYNRYNVLLSDGETQYYLGNPASPTPIGFSTNIWQAKITASILPTSLIPSCTPVTPAPHITYSPTIYQFTTGVSASINAPANTGGAGTFSVSPTLPVGLALSATGAISGVPTTVTTSAIYTVTCTNSAGISSVGLQISVSAPVLLKPSISYSPNSINVTVGSNVPVLTPNNSGGAVATWAISPSMPSNLTFSSGVISGQALVVQAQTSYTVTATNTSGSSTATITVQVNPQPPLAPSINYPASSYVLTQNSSVTISPTNTGGVGVWSVTSGILPTGLSLNSTTGVIIGTPTSLQNPTNATITCSNVTGSSPFTISFAVNAPPTTHWYLINNSWFGPVFQ